MKKTERFKMIASSYLLYIKEDKILLSRRFQTGYEDGKYSVPAGHVEDEETLTQALCREVHEEVGITVGIKHVQLVHVMHRKENDIRVDFFFVVKNLTETPINKEPHKCDDLDWFPLDHLPANTVEYIRKAIKSYQKGIFYSEVGWEI